MTRPAREPEPPAPPSERGFWYAFTGGWIALAGLLFSGEVAQSSIEVALVGVFVGVMPMAAVAVVVALQRRRLLRPEWTLPRALAVHALIGLGYALSTTLISTGLVFATGYQIEGLDVTPWALVFFRVISGLFFYAVLAGFLMWSESIVRVHESQALLAREAMLRAEAESKALRAQFNPHFVFNTLHSLMLLVRAEPETAERAIEDVAALIRYASVLQREGVDTVPLESEVGIARRYVALEKLRLQDRLVVDWDVAPDLGRCSIPAFSLQSLLENAIKHGIAPKPEGGQITVRAEHLENELIIRVEDDGEGASVEAVESAEGHGIDLLIRRLEALYGRAAGLNYRTEPGAGFDVTLILPFQKIGGDSGAAGGAVGTKREEAQEDLLPQSDHSTS